MKLTYFTILLHLLIRHPLTSAIDFRYFIWSWTDVISSWRYIIHFACNCSRVDGCNVISTSSGALKFVWQTIRSKGRWRFVIFADTLEICISFDVSEFLIVVVVSPLNRFIIRRPRWGISSPSPFLSFHLYVIMISCNNFGNCTLLLRCYELELCEISESLLLGYFISFLCID